MDWRVAEAPDAAVIEAMAVASVEALPKRFRDHARAVVIQVEEFAEDDILADLDIDYPFELTGLYDCFPLTEKSVSDQRGQPDAIWLFRRAILEEWIERGNVSLSDLVAHVVVHELAHHFGWSDADIASIDEWWA